MICVSLLLFLAACDTPQRIRDPYPTINVNDTPTPEISGTPTTNTNPEDPTTPSTDPTGFEACDLDTPLTGSTSPSIGSFKICQSTIAEAKFKLKMTVSDSVNGTCFVPINIDTTSKATSIGTAECVHNEAAKVYEFNLTKDQEKSINGVMALKAYALSDYVKCMSAKVTFLNWYAPNCVNDQNCVQAADNYAFNTCNQFVIMHQSNYKEVRF